MSDPTFYSDGDTPRRMSTQLQTLQKILGATLDGNAGGGTAGVFAGAYSGGQPNNVASPVNGDIATDTSAPNRQWVYLNGSWT